MVVGREGGRKGRRIQHPTPTAIAKSVSTSAFPRFGITHSFAAYKSYPAANALPLVGVFALSDNFFTKSGGGPSLEDSSGAGF